MPVLICGGDSMIGSALGARLKSAGQRVLLSTRRPERAGPEAPLLNLAELPQSPPVPPGVRAVVLCAAMTRIDACKADPAAARTINVEATLAVARAAAAHGAHVVFLSTNQVFDGEQPCRSEDDATCPVTEYGRTKADAERLLRQHVETLTIVRLTKIFGSAIPLFQAWRQALERGAAIQPFTDMPLAPAPLASVLSVLEWVLAQRATGVYQVSGERDYSYAEAAALLAQRLGAPSELVQPRHSREAGIQEASPRHTTLSTQRLQADFGCAPPCVSWTLEQAFFHPETLAGRLGKAAT
jgi:dTDP-4-dehydrorhamnose reductase